TLSRWDEAEQFFTTALTINARLRARPLLARTQYEYAQMLSIHGQEDDFQRAEELLAQAFATAQELGLTQRLATVEALREEVRSTKSDPARTPNSPQPPVSNPQHPTPNIFRQEEDFWTLGYDGLTVQLPAAKGLYHLATLLREPGREFHVFDLLAMTDL